MSPRRRFRTLREKAWWVSAQSIVNALTVGIIIATFLFEGMVKDASKDSQQLLPLTIDDSASIISPSHELHHSDLKIAKEVMEVEIRGASHKEPISSPDLTGNTSKPSMQTTPTLRADTPINSSQIVTNVSMKNESTARKAHEKYEAPLNASPSDEATQNVLKSPQQFAAKEFFSGNTENKSDISAGIEGFRQFAGDKALKDALKKRKSLKSSEDETTGDLKHDVPNVNLDIQSKPGNFSFLNTNTTEEVSRQFQGIEKRAENAQLFEAEDVTRLSYMLYRLIVTHKISSLLDVPCTTSIQWMPALLQRLEFEIPKFHYRCVVPDDEHLVTAVLNYKDLGSAVSRKDSTFWASKLPRTDLAFVWYGIGYMPPKESWMLLKALRKAGTKYVVVPNHPDVTRNQARKTDHGRVNVRRAPYLFDEPFRLVNNISSTSMRKQLLMYELAAIRSDLA